MLCWLSIVLSYEGQLSSHLCACVCLCVCVSVCVCACVCVCVCALAHTCIGTK